MSESGLNKASTRTEAEVRALGHTQTPWKRDASSGVSCDVRAENGRKVALCWGLSTTKAAQHNTPAYKAECSANAHFIVLACNAHDAMRAALDELLEQIECLGGIEYSRDVEPYKAEANWNDAVRRAENALALARGVKP